MIAFDLDRHPEPFECVIEPRGGEVSGMLALAREKAVD